MIIKYINLCDFEHFDQFKIRFLQVDLIILKINMSLELSSFINKFSYCSLWQFVKTLRTVIKY